MLQRPKISSLDLFFAPTTSLKNVNLGKTGNGQDIKQQIVEKLNSEREPYFLWHQCQRVDSLRLEAFYKTVLLLESLSY